MTPERELQLVLQERDRTFALMLERIETLEAERDGPCQMTSAEIKEARHTLGLSASQLAKLLDTDPQTIRRMEQSEAANTFRRPAPRMVRLIRAYLDGYRPGDWPMS